jgi:integrase
MFLRMATKAKKPEFIHCKVRPSANTRAPWRVWYDAERDGKTVRLFKTFAAEDAAYAFAQEKDVEISNHGVRYGDIPPEVRRAYDYFRDQSAELRSIGAEVPRFEELITRSLAEIRALHNRKEENQITVAEAVVQFIDYKKTRVGERQLANLTDQLKRFAQDHGTSPLSSITTAEVEKWLSSLRNRRNPQKLAETPFLSPISRNHHRAALHAFFAYASAPARALCPMNPLAHLEPEKVTTSEPKAYSPQSVARIMQTALDQKPELVPVLALGMFSGLRVSEAINADLSKLPKGKGEFRTTGKTGPRMAPFTESAAAWIKAQPRRTGQAWTQSARALVDHMQELFTLAKVEQIDNGARHSFISYRTAETRDVARVADECGNSVATIKNHYRQLVTSEAATKYFAIRPETEASKQKKIVSFKGGKSA